MKLKIIRTEYGTAFFDEKDELVQYIHENDGDWRGEYFDPIPLHFGIEVEHPAKLSKKQREKVKEYEG